MASSLQQGNKKPSHMIKLTKPYYLEVKPKVNQEINLIKLVADYWVDCSEKVDQVILVAF